MTPTKVNPVETTEAVVVVSYARVVTVRPVMVMGAWVTVAVRPIGCVTV